MTEIGERIERTAFQNGLVLITERMPHVRSVSVGVWVATGSRAEPAELNGISHFIEHMVFKGTAQRSAEDVAREADRIGGMLDAFTAKELVCFNTRVIDEHLPQAFDILADIVLHPRFPEEEIAREQSVILEEIKMVEDNPEDLVHEVFAKNFWRDHPLGRPILGLPETVKRFDRATLQDWFHRWYAPNRMVITAAGHLIHRQLVDLTAERFSALLPVKDVPPEAPPAPQPQITLRSKSDLEQMHICLGVPACSMSDGRRYAASLLNNLLGGGMSSRLFQNIREKQGLAYAVFSEMSPYRDTGLLSVYAGTAQETAERLVRSVLTEFRSLKQEPVTEEELRRAKDHLKSGMLLSLESSSARMSDLARQHIYFGHYLSPEERIAQLEAVTREDLQCLARQFFEPGRVAATVLGPLNGFSLTPEQLSC